MTKRFFHLLAAGAVRTVTLQKNSPTPFAMFPMTLNRVQIAIAIAICTVGAHSSDEIV